MASMSGVAANDSCVGMWEKLKAGKIKVPILQKSMSTPNLVLPIQSRKQRDCAN